MRTLRNFAIYLINNAVHIVNVGLAEFYLYESLIFPIQRNVYK